MNVDTTAECHRCRPTGRCRFGIAAATRDEADRLRATAVCPTDYEGHLGIAHGGWTATVLDEMLGLVATMHGVLPMTAELSVSYRRPIPVGKELVFTGWVAGRERGRWSIEGDLRLVSSGEVLARGKGVWVERDRATHEAALAAWVQATAQ